MPPRILVFSDSCLPGSKGGGAVSALASLVELLGDDYDSRVMTRNRDLKEACLYEAFSGEQ
jgi:hypothetical protein